GRRPDVWVSANWVAARREASRKSTTMVRTDPDRALSDQLAYDANRVRQRSEELRNAAADLARKIAETEAAVARTLGNLAPDCPAGAARLLARWAAAIANEERERRWLADHQQSPARPDRP